MNRIIATTILTVMPLVVSAQEVPNEDLRTQVAVLTLLVKQMDHRVRTLEDTNATLASDLTDLLESEALLRSKLERFSVSSDGREITLKGANLRLVNGEGSTDTVNGYGNLIVGYDEETLSYPFYDPEGAASEKEGGSRKGGSHNLVIGTENSYESYAGIVAGQRNRITQPYAVVSAGYGNMANGPFASVSGGTLNQAKGSKAVAAGGVSNRSTGEDSFVGGGRSNRAQGSSATVLGGQSNRAEGKSSSVAGGFVNVAKGEQSSLLGGTWNTTTGQRSSIVGGSLNRAEAYSAVSVGGVYNTAQGNTSVTVGGRFNRTSGSTSVSLGSYATHARETDQVVP